LHDRGVDKSVELRDLIARDGLEGGIGAKQRRGKRSFRDRELMRGHVCRLLSRLHENDIKNVEWFTEYARKAYRSKC
jgi:hypothetical protein